MDPWIHGSAAGAAARAAAGAAAGAAASAAAVQSVPMLRFRQFRVRPSKILRKK